MTHNITRYSLIALLILIAYLSFVVIRPFMSYLIFSVVLVILFLPLYDRLAKKLKRPRVSSILLVALLILLLVLPSIFIGYQLIKQAPTAYEQFAVALEENDIGETINSISPIAINLDTYLTDTTGKFRTYVLSQAGTFLAGAVNLVLGLFIMFFVMYYLFIEGRVVLEKFVEILPLSKKYTNALLLEINQVVHGTIQGQLVLGILQGVLGGLTFWILGLANPLFWGFLMVIASIIPLIGSFIVWVPAAIWLLLTGSVTEGIVLLLVGFLIISQIDNFLRPYIVGRASAIHPVVVLVGVLGGLKVFGIIGFITGPLILALFVQLLQFFAKNPVAATN